MLCDVVSINEIVPQQAARLTLLKSLPVFINCLTYYIHSYFFLLYISNIVIICIIKVSYVTSSNISNLDVKLASKSVQPFHRLDGANKQTEKFVKNNLYISYFYKFITYFIHVVLLGFVY